MKPNDLEFGRTYHFTTLTGVVRKVIFRGLEDNDEQYFFMFQFVRSGLPLRLLVRKLNQVSDTCDQPELSIPI